MRIVDIGSLALVSAGPTPGPAMRAVEFLPDAVVHVRDGRIAWVGRRADEPPCDDADTVSAHGGCVCPGLIDCHTHIPFAGSRSGEFVRRIGGESYLSILQSGGGIRVTTAAVRAATGDQLVEESLPRLARMLAHGVTTVECKSGYGLSDEHELKQLRATRALGRRQPIELISTYLGPHAVPAEFDGRADDYIDSIVHGGVLETIAREQLAVFCDVFCDRGAFDTDQARRVLTSAAAVGLRSKLHADELKQIGASRLAGELRAVSADHLEEIDDGGIEALRVGGTVAVVLPGTSFYLGIPHAPARRMMDAGLPLAIATDFNPGSCPIESLPMVMNIACCQLRMLPVEVLVACTANAAAAIGQAHRLGATCVGHQADLLVLDAPGIDEWMYTPGRPRTRAVIKAGRVVYAST